MKTKIIKYLSLILIAFVFAGGCKLGNNLAYINLSDLYEPDKKPKINGIRIFNESDTGTKVFLRYALSDLQYKKPIGKSYYKAKYKFEYKLFISFESNEIIDSAGFYLSDSLFYGMEKEKIFDFNVKADYPGNYLLEIEYFDLNSGASIKYPENIFKDSYQTSQFYLPVDEENEIIFGNYISGQQYFKILCGNKSVDQLYVRYFRKHFPIALPPFSTEHQKTFQYIADKFFSIKVTDQKSELLNFPEKGIFQFLADTSGRTGLTIFRFNDDYPKLEDAPQLVPPLRYLTTNKEFKQLIKSPDQKMAVDSFWLATAGNENRALALIKNYYSRVEKANELFTSYQQGWKTDRGMIYIIFGQPKTVYKRDDIETWIYGEQGNRISLNFDFIKMNNPFTNNDYLLRRLPSYKNSWFIAVDYWRR